MLYKLNLVTALAWQAQAYPWISGAVRDGGLKSGKPLGKRVPGDAASCPYNPHHVDGIGATAEFPYCGARNGLPGNLTCQNNVVPAPGDVNHQYRAPGPNDIRGPCPALNTLANHGFIGRDGITNFIELVDAQQNVFGAGYDLAVALALVGVGLDGDPLTTKLSIGCDATSRTATPGLGPELGLDGHNKFEGDTSLSRSDYFTNGFDNYSFNQTLFDMMLRYCDGHCDVKTLAKYRYNRYLQSRAENGNFAYGPVVLLLYAAATLVYELLAPGNSTGSADPVTMDYFFRQGTFPPGWYSRVSPYNLVETSIETSKMYLQYPVAFGGNTGAPNSFVGVGVYGNIIQNSTLRSDNAPAALACFIYQVLSLPIPSSLGGGGALPTTILQKTSSIFAPIFSKNGSFAEFGCPIDYNTQ